jgi:hypothetical protein
VSGTLGLSTPWAKEGITHHEREAVEAVIPDGMTLGVSMTSHRAYWLLWLVADGEPITSKLKVSGTLRLKAACLWALETHWKVAA